MNAPAKTSNRTVLSLAELLTDHPQPEPCLIEPSLLVQEVLGGRLGGFILQRQMHALMATVLLRMSGLDALEVDPKS